RTIEFRHALIVITSNLSHDYLTTSLRPELLDRIDEIVAFKPLGFSEIERIVELQLEEVRTRIAGRSILLVLSADARRYLAHESIAAGSGARFVSRAIARYVTTPLSNALLRGEIQDGATARVEYDGTTILI